MPREVRLPEEFDYRVKPTVKRDWFRLAGGKRPFVWWWHVAYTVRVKRVRHADEETIKRVMRLVDEYFQKKSEEQER